MELQFSTACLLRIPLGHRFAAARACGVDGVELTLTPALLRHGPAHILALSEQHGVTVRSIAIEALDGALADGAVNGALAVFVAALPSCRVLVLPAPRAGSNLNAYLGLVRALSVALAGRATVTIANAAVGAPGGPGPLDRFPQLRRIVEEWDLGFTFDTSHAASAGWVITEPLPQMGRRLQNVHLGDFRQEPGVGPHELGPLLPDHVRAPQLHRLPGEGVLPLRALLRALRRREYAGLVTIDVRERGLRAWWPPATRARLAATVAFCREAVRDSDPLRPSRIEWAVGVERVED